MKICYFGIYNPEYSRNKILIKGLRANGATVLEVNSRRIGSMKYFDLIKQFWSLRKKFDVMVVGFPGMQSIILAKLLTRRPVIFDAFLSMYDSEVNDRKTIAAGSWRAHYYHFMDKLGCQLADLILLDTNAHIEYFIQEFKIKKEKFRRIWVGADNDVFFPVAPKKACKRFTIHFHGHFIPLQGVEYIIRAAKILIDEDIIFNIIGQGQEHAKMRSLAQELGVVEKLNFIPTQPLASLPGFISEADICLGIFGDTDKAARVIPNKIYECAAMRKPIITADTPAIRELFDQDSISLCAPHNPEDLARKIIKLKENAEKRKSLADNSLVVMSRINYQKLGWELRQIINELTSNKK